MKSAKEIKYLFITSGPGETGQARAVARYIAQKGGNVLFGVRQSVNLSFISGDKEFKTFIAENPLALKEVIEREKPDVLFVCHSKIGGFKDFQEMPPFAKPSLIVCMDSNWLFNDKLYPAYKFIKWADIYFTLFPKRIFEMGLKSNGGDFVISRDLFKKVISVGFVPAYKRPSAEVISDIRKKYRIKENEKIIFSYFSGLGASHRIFALYNMIDAVDRLVKQGKKIKVLYIGPTEDLDLNRINRDWLMIKNELSSDDYFNSLASSDLIFQHQGMVTLAQAISAQVPVICNIHLLKGKPISMLHFWEVSPFYRAGVCEMITKSTPIPLISEKIDKLLFNAKTIEKMKNKQKDIFENGEEKVYNIISESLKKTYEKGK